MENIMDNLKKIGLTALAGSLAAISANAAEMSVSGASVLTYTSEDTTENEGNSFGMKTNLAFTASGDVNGYTVSYYQASADQFAGMSSASLTIDMGDMGKIKFDQGSGSGLSNIDDKTPTAAEEVWDGLDVATGTSEGGLVGAGNSGAWNYVNTYGGWKLDASYLNDGGGTHGDGATSPGSAESSIDFAVTGALSDQMAVGFGYGKIGNNTANDLNEDDTEYTIFANYTFGMGTFGYQYSNIDEGTSGGVNQVANAWGLAVNVNDNLSVSYGEREVEYQNPGAVDVTEDVEGFAVAYTMGSIKIAGNINEAKNRQGTTDAKDEMTEIAVSFAF
jgi:outer membrane protein OmpU